MGKDALVTARVTVPPGMFAKPYWDGCYQGYPIALTQNLLREVKKTQLSKRMQAL